MGIFPHFSRRRMYARNSTKQKADRLRDGLLHAGIEKRACFGGAGRTMGTYDPADRFLRRRAGSRITGFSHPASGFRKKACRFPESLSEATTEKCGSGTSVFGLVWTADVQGDRREGCGTQSDNRAWRFPVNVRSPEDTGKLVWSDKKMPAHLLKTNNL